MNRAFVNRALDVYTAPTGRAYTAWIEQVKYQAVALAKKWWLPEKHQMTIIQLLGAIDYLQECLETAKRKEARHEEKQRPKETLPL